MDTLSTAPMSPDLWRTANTTTESPVAGGDAVSAYAVHLPIAYRYHRKVVMRV
jgi:hypothetical protein